MWTPTALASEFRRYAGIVWRVVEAQHRISTNRLAGSLEEQARLEELAEAAKPDLPKSAYGLHYLLASPFRYGHMSATRFRSAHERPGIFYASEAESTAIAETAYWRLRFFSRSPEFSPGSTTSEHLSYSVKVSAERALDLTAAPFDSSASDWISNDYSICQKLGSNARVANAQAIRSISARDPQQGCNVALLDPAVFSSAQPNMRQTWHLRFEDGRLSCIAAFPGGGAHTFVPSDFGLSRAP